MKTLSHVLFVALSALCCTPAFAQRESFETGVTRKAEITIIEVLTPPPSPKGQDSASRKGRNNAGREESVLTSKKSVVFDNIYFEFDTAKLRDRASELLVDDIAAGLKSPKLKDARFLIEGHTCDLGEDDYNLNLSAQRAETIRQLLIKRGIRADKLVALGFGERELVETVKKGDAASLAEQKRMKSRRVVLRRLIPDNTP
ncbi:MAG: OmpA family protein [Prosthecobacter sp.]